MKRNLYKLINAPVRKKREHEHTKKRDKKWREHELKVERQMRRRKSDD